ncbi:hypothetical protein D3C71_1907880 [compost metagenome]
MHHPVVAGLQQHRDGRARHLLARIDGAHIGLEQAHAAHGFMHRRRAQGREAVGCCLVGTLNIAVNHTEFVHLNLLSVVGLLTGPSS